MKKFWFWFVYGLHIFGIISLFKEIAQEFPYSFVQDIQPFPIFSFQIVWVSVIIYWLIDRIDNHEEYKRLYDVNI